MNGLNWHWISIELTVAPLLGLLVAFPFWRKGGFIFGNIVAAALLYAFIALTEVCGLFSLSLVVEKKLRDRDYAPEWR